MPSHIPLSTRLRLHQRFERPPARPPRGGIALGAQAVDAWLGGGLERGALHEVFAGKQADVAAAAGFIALLALRSAGGGAARRQILWVRQDFLDGQTGQLHPPGLAALGLDPALIVLVRARDVLGVLRAAAEVAGSTGFGAVVVELWGESPLLDLTASRRLSLAAEKAGVPVLMLRVAAIPAPSAAASRWLLAGLPSRPLAANAPGPPAFAATLLRHRGGAASNTWHLEWNHEQGCFQDRDAPALPRAVVPLPAERAAVAHARAG